VVRAPFPGQITVRHIELGQTVKVGEPLLSIADVSPMEVKLYLPEKIATQLEPGQPVEIRSDVAPDSPLVGRVSRIAPSVDPATSTVKITLEVEGTGNTVRVGSFIRGRITTNVHEDVVSVPKKALVPEAGVTYLFLAEADTVRRVPVATGYADDTHVEITSGIEEGNQIVTVGQGGLRTGSKIRDLTNETEAEVAAASDQDSATAGDN
jgi:membrane fusion protein (multidrug efflux system)